MYPNFIACMLTSVPYCNNVLGIAFSFIFRSLLIIAFLGDIEGMIYGGDFRIMYCSSVPLSLYFGTIDSHRDNSLTH